MALELAELTKGALVSRSRDQVLWKSILQIATRWLLLAGALLSSIHDFSCLRSLCCSFFCLLFFFLELQCLLLFLSFRFSLLFKDLLILHENNLFHQNSLVWVCNAIKSLIIFRELPYSFCLHVHCDIGSIKVVLIFVIELWGKLHSTNHHRVDYIVDLLLICPSSSTASVWFNLLLVWTSSWALRGDSFFLTDLRLCPVALWRQSMCLSRLLVAPLRYLLASLWFLLHLQDLWRTWCDWFIYLVNWKSRHDVGRLMMVSTRVRPWNCTVTISREHIVGQFKVWLASLLDCLWNLVSRLDEEYLLDTHIVRVNVYRITCFYVFVEIDHILYCLV